MSLTVRVLFVVTLLLSIVIPFGYFLIGQRTKKRYKRAIGTNIFFFFSTVLIAGIMLFAGDPVVSPLQVQQVRLWVQLVKIPVHLVSR